MANYRVDIARAAEKELDELPTKDRDRINVRISALASDPRPYGYEQLSGEKKYRLRQGDFRIVYGIDDAQSVVTVIKIGHRRDVYR
ncbi:MAG: type II toxin-antitoxin system RelE/ParE family toxin [Chloroflexota bacterium]|nr:type II toxin-antitoxin system RelE/ParE family toxin [Chloroflexota bacterium]